MNLSQINAIEDILRMGHDELEQEHIASAKEQNGGILKNNNFSTETKELSLEPKPAENRLISLLQDDVIGDQEIFTGPFGPRRIVYCDYVASGRAICSIEKFIKKRILPTYANTHTISTFTSATTTRHRDEAKDIVRKAVNADHNDVVIFTGSGATGAVHKLIRALTFKKSPIVFCGPFEHHSNLLPWRQLAHEVVMISETDEGAFNYEHLEIALKFWKNSGHPLIGSFSAASNVTGITTDTVRVSELLHKHGGKVFWDYAAGAPYMEINMHPPSQNGDASKDAVFLSMHKFVGSCEAPGLLIASKDLFHNKVPDGCGGGTVLYVTENDHTYLRDIETREEGGTPAIIGSIRAGLAFKLKMDIGCDVIMQRERYLYQKAMRVWDKIDNLEVLGRNPRNEVEKITIFSFLIRHKESGLYLHFNFVSALLNDMFGIQSRGGCACAGVYAQHLLSIDNEFEKKFSSVLKTGGKTLLAHDEKERTDREMLRPGFTRVNFPYFMKDEDADFLIEAVKMICEIGWRLLPLYHYVPASGVWKINVEQKRRCRHLNSFTFDDAALEDAQTEIAPNNPQCLDKAKDIMLNTQINSNACKEIKFPKEYSNLRWFLLPHEALACHNEAEANNKYPINVIRVRTQIIQPSKKEILHKLKQSKKAKKLKMNKVDIESCD